MSAPDARRRIGASAGGLRPCLPAAGLVAGRGARQPARRSWATRDAQRRPHPRYAARSAAWRRGRRLGGSRGRARWVTRRASRSDWLALTISFGICGSFTGDEVVWVSGCASENARVPRRTGCGAPQRLGHRAEASRVGLSGDQPFERVLGAVSCERSVLVACRRGDRRREHPGGLQATAGDPSATVRTAARQ